MNTGREGHDKHPPALIGDISGNTIPLFARFQRSSFFSAPTMACPALTLSAWLLTWTPVKDYGWS